MLGQGPAHAVYFATYETVKQAMGGNEGNAHHPLAAGELRQFIFRISGRRAETTI